MEFGQMSAISLALIALCQALVALLRLREARAGAAAPGQRSPRRRYPARALGVWRAPRPTRARARLPRAGLVGPSTRMPNAEVSDMSVYAAFARRAIASWRALGCKFAIAVEAGWKTRPAPCALLAQRARTDGACRVTRCPVRLGLVSTRAPQGTPPPAEKVGR